jgi:hypothetical protein
MARTAGCAVAGDEGVGDGRGEGVSVGDGLGEGEAMVVRGAVGLAGRAVAVEEGVAVGAQPASSHSDNTTSLLQAVLISQAPASQRPSRR